jgi:hypothetical protein
MGNLIIVYSFERSVECSARSHTEGRSRDLGLMNYLILGNVCFMRSLTLQESVPPKLNYTHSNSKCLKTFCLSLRGLCSAKAFVCPSGGFAPQRLLFVPPGALLRKGYTGSSFFRTF